MRRPPTLTWHPGDDVPHVTPAPTTDDDGRVDEADWARYQAAITALGECPHHVDTGFTVGDNGV